MNVRNLSPVEQQPVDEISELPLAVDLRATPSVFVPRPDQPVPDTTLLVPLPAGPQLPDPPSPDRAASQLALTLGLAWLRDPALGLEWFAGLEPAAAPPPRTVGWWAVGLQDGTQVHLLSSEQGDLVTIGLVPAPGAPVQGAEELLRRVLPGLSGRSWQPSSGATPAADVDLVQLSPPWRMRSGWGLLQGERCFLVRLSAQLASPGEPTPGGQAGRR